MLRKILSLLVMLGLVLPSLAACAGGATQAPAAQQAAEAVKAAAPTVAAAAQQAAPTVAAAAKAAAPTVAAAAKAAAPAGQKAKIVFYQRGYSAGGTDTTTSTTDKAVQEFMKKYPQYEVEIVGIPWTAEGDTKLETALAAGGDGINIFRVTDMNLPRYVKQGILSSVDDVLTDADKADFAPSAFDVATINGKRWAWPLWVTAISVLANPDIFKEQGVALPTGNWTWDDFVAAAKKLTYTKPDGKKVYGVNAAAKPPLFEYSPLVYIDGGRIMTPDAKKFVADSPEFLSALQKLQDLNTVHKVVPPTYGTDDQAALLSQFKDQKNLAMWIATPGTIRGLQNDKVPFEVLPIPTGKLGKPVTTGGIGMYAVVETKDAEKEKAAHELGRWLTGAEVAAAVPGYQLAPSFRKSNTALKGDPAYSKVQDMVQYGIYEPPTTVPNEIRNIGLLSAFQSVMLGQKSPADAMKSIQPEFQAELDKMNK